MSDYPYPKLRKDLDDYPTSLINCDMESTDTGGTYMLIRGKFELFDDEIKSMINEGNASYCLSMLCTATKIKECIPVTEQFMYKITKSFYTDEIEITPGIIMNEEIRGYANPNLNQDYEDSFIILPKGAMIAETEKMIIKLYRDSDAPVGSICEFVIGPHFYYTDHGDKIEISVPKEVFDNSNVLRNAECSQIFTSMFVLPVIQDVIQNYWKDEQIPFSTRWYISLQERISTFFPEGIDNYSAFSVASSILEGMLFESTSYLAKHYGDRNEY